MKVPAILFLVSVLGMAATWGLPDLFLLAVLSTVASAVLLLLAAPKAFVRRERWVVIDGSNVMYWDGETPRIETVQAVVAQLIKQGFTPGVMFDANAGYLLEDRYLHDGAFAKRLGLSQDRVMVVPKGVQADSYILKAARDMGAVIVTNDRFRDWAEEYPEVAGEGYLIKGGYRDGALWLGA